MAKFFTSDTHFNHKSIIQSCHREWKNVWAMNACMIERWNEVVKKGDIVYHLGDFALPNKGDGHDIEWIIDKLNGQIILIKGNPLEDVTNIKNILGVMAAGRWYSNQTLENMIEVGDPTLVAYWALDETEGIVAHDSSGDNDANIIGDPVWQPTGGIVDGALELDGEDDCVTTDSVLNPVDGPFSAFAWIKGGAPGQVVISQTELGGANWLLADSSEGILMTELKALGRGAAALLSQTVITDGNWHRIGLVWDGSQRILYVDDVEVAIDTQSGLGSSEGGLYIGTGKAMEPGSFWSGLIDDVRIYNRVMIP